jgi:hypothetical protein
MLSGPLLMVFLACLFFSVILVLSGWVLPVSLVSRLSASCSSGSFASCPSDSWLVLVMLMMDWLLVIVACLLFIGFLLIGY